MTTHQLTRGQALRARQQLDAFSRRDVTPGLIARVNVRNQSELLEELRDAREASNLSESDLAERLGVDPEIVFQIESGEYELTLTELRQVALGLEVMIDFDVVRPSQVAFANGVEKYMVRVLERLDSKTPSWIDSRHSEDRENFSDAVLAALRRSLAHDPE
ncbi:helix-turn-helix domain-containing protein [Nesterenkonia sp. K-15-9-6]|uniref:helix-turn-helix domain-containing protein n=1 Tax=Nesterenkonia sp. K-15-9-6 TaxID=3093918 RepID=UPI00404425CF